MWVWVVFLEIGIFERWDCLLKLMSELVWLQPLGERRFIFLMDIFGCGEAERAGRRTSSLSSCSSSQQQNRKGRDTGSSLARKR